MTKLLTNHIATMTEMREPHKVLARSGGKPVAIMKNSALVGYLIPAEAANHDDPSYISEDELVAHLQDTRAEVEPILDYLKDK